MPPRAPTTLKHTCSEPSNKQMGLLSLVWVALGPRAGAGVHFLPLAPNHKPHVTLHAPQTPTNPPKSKTIPHRIANPTLCFACSMCASRHKRDRNPQRKQNQKPFLTTNPITNPTSHFVRHKRDKNPNQTKIKNVDVLTVSCVLFCHGFLL